MELGFESRPSDCRAYAFTSPLCMLFYHYLLGARHPYIHSIILSSNWDAHSTDVGTEAGYQGPLSSTNRIWIWTLLLWISALPFLWMTPQKWSQRMFNGICWMGLIMKYSQTLGNSGTHRPDGCMACFLVTMSHPLQSSDPGIMLGPQPSSSLRSCVDFCVDKSHLFIAQFSTCRVGGGNPICGRGFLGGLCLHAQWSA